MRTRTVWSKNKTCCEPPCSSLSIYDNIYSTSTCRPTGVNPPGSSRSPISAYLTPKSLAAGCTVVPVTRLKRLSPCTRRCCQRTNAVRDIWEARNTFQHSVASGSRRPCRDTCPRTTCDVIHRSDVPQLVYLLFNLQRTLLTREVNF